MKFIKYILPFITGMLLGACTQDEILKPTPDENGDTVTLEVSFNVAERGSAHSRAIGQNPDYDNLRLYLVEFDMKGEPLENPLSSIYVAEDETPTPAATPTQVEFKVTLKQSAAPKILHLIAVPKSYDISFGDYGMEGNIIPAIATDNGADAYWQRVEFPAGYGEVDDEGKWTVRDDAKQKLTMVPMIRNFAQVTVLLSTTAAEKFTLEGYALINVPSAGSVAPWNSSTMDFPTYLNGSTQIGYNDLDYTGLVAGNITGENTTDASFTTDPKFLYERPYSSVDHTQLIVKGSYNGEASSYYKIDLGYQADGVFNYYNLLRNFNYVVTIKNVSASGYDTAGEAKNGVVYNNISFDIDTRNMLNISNGSDMMWVNFTTAVVSQNTDAARTLTFRYRYKENIKTNGGTAAYDNVKVVGLDPEKDTGDQDSGKVISEISGPTQDGEWMYYTLKTNAPTAETKTQSFVVVNNVTGLGRTINIILRDPWTVTNVMEYAGNYNIPSQYPFDNVNTSRNHPEYKGYASNAALQPLTVFFRIPENLPEAIFPLSFVMESDKQNIENNPIGSLVVQSGTSYFPDVVGRRIKYVKTVTWDDYNTLTSNDHPTGVMMADPTDATKTIHIVRSRFLTLASLTSLGVTSGEVVITLRIYNQYFNNTDTDSPYFDVQFKRLVNQTWQDANVPNYKTTDN